MICPKCKRTIPDDAALCCYCGKSIHRQTAHIHQRGNGTGTALKRGKTWEARVVLRFIVDEEGKRHKVQKSKGGFKTKTEALEYCSVLKLQAEQAKQKQVPNLEAYWSMYYNAELGRLSVDKQIAYKKAWKRLAPLHNKPVDMLTVSDLRNTVTSGASTYYTCHDMKVVLSHLFKLAAADGFVSKDLPSFIQLPELVEHEREPFTADEQKALWAQWESGNRFAAIPLIMIYTGMMPGELRRLIVSMIDWDNRRITGVGLKTKVRKASPVYIPVAIIPVLEEVASGKDADEKLFRFTKVNFYKHYYEILEVAGCRKLTPYSCRHTTATALAISQNIAPETVRRIMRWSTTAMLQRYAHPDSSAILSAIDTLE